MPWGVAAGDSGNAAYLLQSATTNEFELYQRAGGNAQAVATGDYSVRQSEEFATNRHGWVAFFANRQTGPNTTVEGLYIGPAIPGQNPVKVIEVGDTLPAFFNLPVVGMGNIGMNNANQIVFSVTVQGGIQVILRGDPTPP